MDRAQTHYHIRWSGKEALDWESFSSRVEAETRARQLVRQEEAYTIEEHDETCPRCRDAMEIKTSHQTSKSAVA